MGDDAAFVSLLLTFRSAAIDVWSLHTAAFKEPGQIGKKKKKKKPIKIIQFAPSRLASGPLSPRDLRVLMAEITARSDGMMGGSRFILVADGPERKAPVKRVQPPSVFTRPIYPTVRCIFFVPFVCFRC